jgi:hypothetical protein
MPHLKEAEGWAGVGMENRLETALEDASKARADLYRAFFVAVEKRVGRESAIAVLKEAVRNWGAGLGHGLKGCRIADLPTVFATQPDGGKLFQPRVDRLDDAGFDVQFEACPLKQRWIEVGLSDGDVELFCEIAAEADYGTLEAAGFDVSIDLWKSGGTGCCHLRIRPVR